MINRKIFGIIFISLGTQCQIKKEVWFVWSL